ncbi:hypothetical protein BZJ17_02605 [Salinivibrio sp. IB574]|uniref:flagellar type III secretion system pore protein FliP n=1 Tax=Salinivibrio sp. IB574 TaxID=1909444 RepID=UPI000989194B|nr:flagellar type III secretion system pore protein FliP [Salinivibrio sp. IB574]OOF23952.1 hypothetical protein BZJ17_02605 [Salinivibrio sp. IB574]
MTIKTLLAAWLFVWVSLFSPATFAQQEATPAQETITTESIDEAGEAVRLQTSRNTGGGIPAVTMRVNPDGSEDYSVTLQILALMTALGFLPAIVILMTSFTRIVVVMAILRQAMGLQQTPSNQVIIGIAMFLTLFIEQVPMTVLIPAFVTSELKTAFQIGFMLFLPFLVIDLVVASVLMAMGMMMLSPMIVSLPFKLMLFVLVDGWNLILSTLAGSFG